MHFKTEFGKKAFEWRAKDFFKSANARDAGESLKALSTRLDYQSLSTRRDLFLAVSSLDGDAD